MEDSDYEIRLVLSKSDPNKIWVRITTPTNEEKAVGFNVHDCNTILQVGEYFYDDLTDDERAHPLIQEARAALALACYYPEQFATDPDYNEVITYLASEPTSYISRKHIENVFEESFDIAAEADGWKIYDSLIVEDEDKDAKGSAQSQVGKAKNTQNKRKHEESDSEDFSDELDSGSFSEEASYSDEEASGSYSYSDEDSY